MKTEELIILQQNYFNSNATKDIDFRITMLRKLYHLIQTNEKEIAAALYQDLSKSDYEAYLTEIGIVLSEISTLLRHIRKWAKPKRVATPLALFPSSSRLYQEPYGVVLVMSPWNYPFQLALAPVAGAIAAGNCVLIKGSQSSAATTALLKRLINEHFDPCFMQVLDNEEGYDAILAQKYDYIFFTGSERVGKIVMKAASEHCTPVSLELGGKSPAIVDASADLTLAARRILWGKIINSGQTCVAPDYVLVDQAVKDKLIEELLYQKEALLKDPVNNPDYPKIINSHHYERLSNLLTQQKHKSQVDKDDRTRKIAPVLFTQATFDDPIMQEEIFGPILPIISYSSLDWAIMQVKQHPKPLACYLFSKNQHFLDRLVHEVSYGGGCINDTVMHLANHHLPFGGIGSSGMGSYHGKASFDTFSHTKSVLNTPLLLDMPFRYPPYNRKLLKLIKLLLK